MGMVTGMDFGFTRRRKNTVGYMKCRCSDFGYRSWRRRKNMVGYMNCMCCDHGNWNGFWINFWSWVMFEMRVICHSIRNTCVESIISSDDAHRLHLRTTGWTGFLHPWPLLMEDLSDPTIGLSSLREMLQVFFCLSDTCKSWVSFWTVKGFDLKSSFVLLFRNPLGPSHFALRPSIDRRSSSSFHRTSDRRGLHRRPLIDGWP